MQCFTVMEPNQVNKVGAPLILVIVVTHVGMRKWLSSLLNLAFFFLHNLFLVGSKSQHSIVCSVTNGTSWETIGKIAWASHDFSSSLCRLLMLLLLWLLFGFRCVIVHWFLSKWARFYLDTCFWFVFDHEVSILLMIRMWNARSVSNLRNL